ncbi:MAG: hypothetical protein RJA98_2887 [Pseudomonadota bacterium]|jgi:hypothetical protein
MAPLHALVYVSTARHRLSLDEIDHLLERARVRNERVGVTGVLLYNDGNFMQYLEGPAAGMAEVYAAIQRDALHSGLIELQRDTPPHREFQEWSMGFRASSAIQMPDDPRADRILAERLQLQGAPRSLSHALLNRFWGQGCRPLAF